MSLRKYVCMCPTLDEPPYIVGAGASALEKAE